MVTTVRKIVLALDITPNPVLQPMASVIANLDLPDRIVRRTSMNARSTH